MHCDAMTKEIQLTVTEKPKIRRISKDNGLLSYSCNRDCTHTQDTKKLPEEIGLLECLKELDMSDTQISHLPQSIFWLKDLRIVANRLLPESCGLTPKIRRISKENDQTFCYI